MASIKAASKLSISRILSRNKPVSGRKTTEVYMTHARKE